MDNVGKLLTSLGVCGNESKVYLCLLKNGSMSVGNITKETKINRTNIYSALNKLSGKGLVSHNLSEGVKLFFANNPKNLVLLAEEKLNIAKILADMLGKVKKEGYSESFAEIAEGVNSFMGMLDNFLKYNEDILVYGIPKIAYGLVSLRIGPFHKKRIPKKLWMKHIYNFDNQERVKVLCKMKYTDARCLPSKYSSNVSTNICGKEVVIAIWSDNPKIIRIVDSDIANAYKMYFSILWRSAK